MWSWIKNLISRKCKVLADVKTVPGVGVEKDQVAAFAIKNKDRYKALEKLSSVPWDVCVALHYREASLDFNTCLHNGDPLPGPTTHVPKGRGPFLGPKAWEEAACDAILLEKHKFPLAWDTAGKLDFCEKYNGLGYRNRGLVSPYVYAGTDKYISGLFVKDGVFDSSKVDRRLGCAVIIKELEGK